VVVGWLIPWFIQEKLFYVGCGESHQNWIIPEMPYSPVAMVAEHPSDLTCFVIVVNDQFAV